MGRKGERKDESPSKKRGGYAAPQKRSKLESKREKSYDANPDSKQKNVSPTKHPPEKRKTLVKKPTQPVIKSPRKEDNYWHLFNSLILF